MEDFLKLQINENCKLALPEGLKDLMSDISREVLRAQPQNINEFIADYLEALLEVRETLKIAGNVCTETCDCICEPSFAEDLKNIGLDDEDVETVVEIVKKCLQDDEGSVKEQNLFLKLIRKTNIEESQVPAIREAIQQAYKRHRINAGKEHDLIYQNEVTEEIKEPVLNTLKYYQNKGNPKNEDNQNEEISVPNNTKHEPKEIFVAPEFKPLVYTVSSTTLAGSFIRLPKLKPYSVHSDVMLPTISEMERVSIYYDSPITEDLNESDVKPKARGIAFKNIKEKDILHFDYDEDVTDNDNTNSVTDNESTGEVQDVSEHIESEKLSPASSVAELVHDLDHMAEEDEMEFE